MALLFCDGFDHYDPGNTAEHLRKWGSSNAAFVSATGRSGSGNALGMRAGAGGENCKKYTAASQTVICGFGLKGSGSISYLKEIFRFLDSADGAHLSLWINTTGRFEIRNSVGILATTSAAIVNDTWDYYEFKITVHPTTGSFEFRKNGINVASDTNVDTFLAGDNNCYGIRFTTHGQFGLVYATDVDDVYVIDDSGSAPANDFLGEVVVATVMPDGDDTNDWTATGAGTTNADRVNETEPDDDTTYVEASTVADQERYDYAALPADIDTIIGVQVVPCVRKADDGGSRTFRTTAYSVATEAVGETVGLGTSYVYVPQIFEQDPDSSAAWTPATLNAAKFGFEIVA